MIIYIYIYINIYIYKYIHKYTYIYIYITNIYIYIYTYIYYRCVKIDPTERVRTGSFCVPRHSGEMAERCGRRGELEPSGEICGKTSAFLHTTFGLQKHRTHGGWYFLVSF